MHSEAHGCNVFKLEPIRTASHAKMPFTATKVFSDFMGCILSMGEEWKGMAQAERREGLQLTPFPASCDVVFFFCRKDGRVRSALETPKLGVDFL